MAAIDTELLGIGAGRDVAAAVTHNTAAPDSRGVSPSSSVDLEQDLPPNLKYKPSAVLPTATPSPPNFQTMPPPSIPSPAFHLEPEEAVLAARAHALSPLGRTRNVSSNSSWTSAPSGLDPMERYFKAQPRHEKFLLSLPSGLPLPSPRQGSPFALDLASTDSVLSAEQPDDDDNASSDVAVYNSIGAQHQVDGFYSLRRWYLDKYKAEDKRIIEACTQERRNSPLQESAPPLAASPSSSSPVGPAPLPSPKWPHLDLPLAIPGQETPGGAAGPSRKRKLVPDDGGLAVGDDGEEEEYILAGIGDMFHGMAAASYRRLGIDLPPPGKMKKKKGTRAGRTGDSKSGESGQSQSQ